ncbi:hypothetical protein PLIIFM63780_000778 [Purpureocillium lilacinum]|nr:hypothetical protein PLIIFM63780_000778 [Purpureocillium lilacinum]
MATYRGPDDELALRMRQLGLALGRQVTLIPLDEDNEAVVPASNDAEENQDDSELARTLTVGACISFMRGLRPENMLEPEAQSPGGPAPVDVGRPARRENASEGVNTDYFCPWRAVLSYPDHFIGRRNRPRARPFFNDILTGRVWDFFYLHDPRNPDLKPHLLVPTAQFVAFLAEINGKLDTELTIPPHQNRQKFCFRFGLWGLTPQPRHLARSENKHSLDDIEWPQLPELDWRGFNESSLPHQVAFLKEFDRLLAPNPITQAERAQVRERRRAVDRQAMMIQVQTQLGLVQEETTRDRPIFICIDVEALEDPPHPISEVGLAILDAEKIRIIAPGTNGSNWWPFIECIHLRTEEYSGFRNHKYVHGCPESFNFGRSKFPKKEQMPGLIRRLFERFGQGGRKIMFVAHDSKQDLKFLHQIGIDCMALPGVIGAIDTVVLHQKWRDSNDARSLRTLLTDLGMEYRNLHNAGNDAMYTMRAMLGLASEDERKTMALQQGKLYVPLFRLAGSR